MCASAPSNAAKRTVGEKDRVRKRCNLLLESHACGRGHGQSPACSRARRYVPSERFSCQYMNVRVPQHDERIVDPSRSACFLDLVWAGDIWKVGGPERRPSAIGGFGTKLYHWE